ncbi:MAG: 6-bladed beta-propeller [Longimonas sp.]|uniref:6-bladed beta-propeller n=1 Tax=Longimonas sp. TaxID=2039626 RepID=UPI00334810D4
MQWLGYWGAVVVVIASGCAADRTGSDSFSDLPQVEVTPTVEITDDPAHDLYFRSNSFRDVAVGSDGAVFASNFMQASVFRFDAEGTYQETIGEGGAGPGEFETSPVFTLSTNNDTLYALGRFNEHAMSVFARLEGKFEYVRTVLLPENKRHRPHALHAISEDKLAVEYRPRIQRNRSDSGFVSIVTPAGVVENDTLWTFPADVVWQSDPEEGGGAMVQVPIPYGSASVVRSGPDGSMYYLWTGDAEITVRDGYDGSVQQRITHSEEPVPLEGADIDSILTEQVNVSLDERGPEPIREQVRTVMPDSAPPLIDMWVDPDTGAILARRPLRADANLLLFDETGTPQYTARLPATLSIVAFRRGQIYAVHTNESTPPAIHVFEINANYAVR